MPGDISSNIQKKIGEFTTLLLIQDRLSEQK